MTMNPIQQQIERLRILITEQEQTIIALEQDIAEIEADLHDFRQKYEQLIQPIANRIEAVEKAISALQDMLQQQSAGKTVNVEQLWRSDNSGYTIRPEPAPASPANPSQDDRLKQLYRDLARRYHPDLATDETERQQRTELMALINQAYRDRDEEMLAALNADRAAPRIYGNNVTPGAVPVEAVLLERLQIRSSELGQQIRDLKDLRSDLRNGSIMQLKIEASLAQAVGRDLLTELVDSMEAIYWDKMRELDQLRSDLQSE